MKITQMILNQTELEYHAYIHIMYNYKNSWWLNFCDQLKFKVVVFVDIPVDVVPKCRVIFTKIARKITKPFQK